MLTYTDMFHNFPNMHELHANMGEPGIHSQSWIQTCNLAVQLFVLLGFPSTNGGKKTLPYRLALETTLNYIIGCWSDTAVVFVSNTVKTEVELRFIKPRSGRVESVM